RCQLVLDTSSSMYYPEKGLNKLLFSIYAAASLMYLLKKQRDAFGLTFFSDKIEFSAQQKSTAVHLKYLFSELQKLMSVQGAEKKTAVAATLHQIAEQIHKRSLVVIFSDMFENGGSLAPVFSALQHLKYKKHEVVVFNVHDRKSELDFDFENRPYHFVDIETGEEMKVNPAQVRENYLRAVQEHQKEL